MKRALSVDLKGNSDAILQKSKNIIFDSIGFGGGIGFVLVVLGLSFLLLSSSSHLFSLYALLDWILLLSPHEQLVAMIIIPIYLAILIFGGSILGIIIGNYFQKWLSARYALKKTILSQSK